MGQATVDLPDPMGPPPATAGGTDELLAQLAGEEIDRLLAEADAEQAAGEKPGENAALRANPACGIASPAVPGAPSRGASLAEAADAELSAQLDNLFADLTVNAPDSPLLSAAPVEPTTPPPASPPAISADDLIASTVAPTQPPIAVQSQSNAASDSADALIHPVEEELRETEALERGARAAPADAPEDSTLAALAAEETRPLPLFLRPLEWINAPLDAFPESVRNLVGKVAILTTINALSILAYVFFFRRH
jgi:hypothetical protein